MVGFNAYYSQQPTASVSSDHSVSQYITQSRNFDLVASWSIFDGLATRGAKLSALSSKRSYERTLRTTVDQAMAQARDLAQQLAFAWRALDLSQRRCDMAESAVSGVTDNVKRGLMSANEIGAAQLNSNQSELILAITRADFLNQWSQFVSTLCVDPMLTIIPDRYLPDGK
jgi:outer membrane protein TolC